MKQCPSFGDLQGLGRWNDAFIVGRDGRGASRMGYRRHNILKCHTCKRYRAIGGSKKAGRLEDAKQSGWALTKTEAGAWVWLCPACAREHRPARNRQLPGREGDGADSPARGEPRPWKG